MTRASVAVAGPEPLEKGDARNHAGRALEKGRIRGGEVGPTPGGPLGRGRASQQTSPGPAQTASSADKRQEGQHNFFSESKEKGVGNTTGIRVWHRPVPELGLLTMSSIETWAEA